MELRHKQNFIVDILADDVLSSLQEHILHGSHHFQQCLAIKARHPGGSSDFRYSPHSLILQMWKQLPQLLNTVFLLLIPSAPDVLKVVLHFLPQSPMHSLHREEPVEIVELSLVILPLLVSFADHLDNVFDQVSSVDDVEDHHTDGVHGLHGVGGRGPWSHKREGATGEELRVEILDVPRGQGDVFRVGVVVAHPEFGRVGLVGIVAPQLIIHQDIDGCDIMRHHEGVEKQVEAPKQVRQSRKGCEPLRDLSLVLQFFTIFEDKQGLNPACLKSGTRDVHNDWQQAQHVTRKPKAPHIVDGYLYPVSAKYIGCLVVEPSVERHPNVQ